MTMLGNSSFAIFYEFLEGAIGFQDQIIGELPDLVFLTDRDGRIMKCNGIWLKKFAPDTSPIGKGVGEAFSGQTADHFTKLIHHSGLRYAVQVIGDTLWKSALIHEKAWIHIGADISTVRQTYQQVMVQAGRRESVIHFAAGLAHEFNNPLAILRVAIDRLHEEAQRHMPQGLRMTEIAMTAIERLAKIVAVFRQVGQDSSEELGELVDFNIAVDEACQLVRETLIHHQIALSMRLMDQAPLLMMRRSLILDALLQLLHNAIDALRPITARAREIAVETTVDADSLTFSLSDNGIGIKAGDLGQIFDPFFTTKEITQGRGLGLSLVHQAFKEIGASIDVQSQEGVYTRVTVVIPLEVKGDDHERPARDHQSPG